MESKQHRETRKDRNSLQAKTRGMNREKYVLLNMCCFLMVGQLQDTRTRNKHSPKFKAQKHLKITIKGGAHVRKL